MKMFNEIYKTYEIKGKIGEGGGGIVYLAYHKRLEKYVVFKEIKRPNRQMSSNRREADILKKIRHEALPGVIDFLEIDGKYYTVMDYIPGLSLEKWLHQKTLSSQQQLIDWGIVLCRAMECLHTQDPPVIHCDIKPSNIIIDNHQKIHLIDFNISYYMDQSGSLGYSKGFSAPEIEKAYFEGKSSSQIRELISPAIDVYGLGSVLYYALTGKTVNPSSPEWQNLDKRISEGFASVIKKATDPNPLKRFQSASAMRQALQDIQKNDERLKALRKRTRQKILICAVSFAMFTVMAGFSVFLMRQENEAEFRKVILFQTNLIEQGRYDEAYSLMGKADEIKKDDLQTYYTSALALYNKGDFKATAELLNNKVAGKEAFLKEDNIENAYYILADSLFRMDRYPQSVDVFEQLILMDELELYYYRDYAIAVGYNGQIDEAESILENAIALGLSNDNIEYVRAELLYLQDSKKEAISRLKQVLGSQDPEINRTALQQLMKWNLDEGDYAEVLELAEQEVPGVVLKQSPILLELKAQAEIDLGNKTDENQYREKAIQTLDLIIQNGWASKSTYNSKSILYEKIGNLEQASQVLDQMETLFGTDYNVYKRRAFIELEKQNQKNNKDRNYTNFDFYYREARNNYDETLNDQEMQILDQIYADVIQGGWI